MIPAALNFPGVVATVRNGLQNYVIHIQNTVFETRKEITRTIFRIKQTIFENIKWGIISILIILVTVILKKPLEFITRVLCAIIVSVAFVFYYISTIPPFHWIAFGIWFFLKYMVGLLLYTIVSGIIFVIISLVFLVIALINFMTKGALNKMALCQTSPLAWYQVPSFHAKNYYERALFCKKPCGMGFAPDKMTGDVCERIPLAQPNFCPQASAMRVFNHDMGMAETGAYTEFLITPRHMSKKPEEKEQEYVDFFTKRQKFFDTCENTMKNYNNVAIDICANLDAIKANKINGLSQMEISKLERICKQGFCNSRKRYAFCGLLNDSRTQMSLDGLIKSIIMLIIYITLFVLLIFMTYKMVLSMKFGDLPFGTKAK